MKPRIVLRQIHHWASIVIALPLLVMIGSGILLMLKKDIDWIQPPSQAGARPADVPRFDFPTLFAAAKAVDKAGLESWADLDRVDVKPDKGMVKFVGTNRWEVQIDTATGAVLNVAYRRSDLIESLHDGSFFADWTKLYLFLPAGIGLLVLWITGVYIFFLPHVMRARKRRRKATPGRDYGGKATRWSSLSPRRLR